MAHASGNPAWTNTPSTPIQASNLEAIENQIDKISNGVASATKKFQGRAIANQTLATASVYTSITLGVADVDDLGGWSSSTNPSRYTCQQTGWYWASGSIFWNTGGTSGLRYAQLSLNGVAIPGSPDITQYPAVYWPQSVVPVLVYMTAGQYLELQGQTPTANTTTYGVSNSGSVLTAYLLP
jgi:hypothetical protein